MTAIERRMAQAVAGCAVALLTLAAGAGGADAQEVVRLWAGDAPGSEGMEREESVRVTPEGEQVVSRVDRPSITAYLPDPARATGAAVLVIPGGGHSELWMDHEGYRVAEWLRARGVAALVLKYRLARDSGASYTVEEHALWDAQRALRLTRSRAAEWRIDPDRVGVIGFSAGGQLAALAGTRFDDGRADGGDPVERESSRPAFMGLIYPAVRENLPLPEGTPPAFLLSGEDDYPMIAEGVARLYLAMKEAGVPVELHVLTGVGHGFGLRWNNPPAVAAWPGMFRAWLGAIGVLSGPVSRRH